MKKPFTKIVFFFTFASILFFSCNTTKDYFLSSEETLSIEFTIKSNATEETKRNIRLQSLSKSEVANLVEDELADFFKEKVFSVTIFNGQKNFELSPKEIMYIGRFSDSQMKEIGIKIKKSTEEDFKKAEFSSKGKTTEFNE